MKKVLGLLALVILVPTISCSHGKKFSTAGAKVSKNGFTLEANWVKDKGKKFDAGIVLANSGKTPLLLEAGAVRCFHGETEGSLTGIDGTVGIPTGGSNSLTVHCNLGTKVSEGAYKLEIVKVWSNPSGDASGKGKEVASNLVLVLQPEK